MKKEEFVKALVAAIEKAERENKLDVQATKMVPVGVSARHIHLAPGELEVLFGKDYQLKPQKRLMGGQFACEETVTLVGPRGVLARVRVLGPVRNLTQVELSTTDCYTLGIEPVLRGSGDIKGTPGIAVVGPRGALYLQEGVIVAWRHIHMKPADADYFGVKDGQMIKARAAGPRGLVLDQVLVRIADANDLELHIDTDEGNAAGLKTGDRVEILC